MPTSTRKTGGKTGSSGAKGGLRSEREGICSAQVCEGLASNPTETMPVEPVTHLVAKKSQVAQRKTVAKTVPLFPRELTAASATARVESSDRGLAGDGDPGRAAVGAPVLRLPRRLRGGGEGDEAFVRAVLLRRGSEERCGRNPSAGGQ